MTCLRDRAYQLFNGHIYDVPVAKSYFMSFYKSLVCTNKLEIIGIDWLENTDGNALVISLISKIRIDDTLCIDSVMLLNPKTIKNNLIFFMHASNENPTFTKCVELGDSHCLN